MIKVQRPLGVALFLNSSALKKEILQFLYSRHTEGNSFCDTLSILQALKHLLNAREIKELKELYEALKDLSETGQIEMIDPINDTSINSIHFRITKTGMAKIDFEEPSAFTNHYIG